MNAIDNTYAGNLNVYDALRGQLQASRPDSSNTGKSEETTTVAKGPTYDSHQQGITSDSSNQKEYKTYGPDGRISSKPESSQSEKEASTKLQKNSSSGASDQTEDLQVQQEIARLKRTEEKVKAHEAAHKSAGGGMTGPVSYTYTRGPDDRNYVTGGEVPITISTGHTPQETINRMQQVIRAALAPADPSPQDRAVAAQANNIQQQARQEQSSQSLQNSSGEATSSADEIGASATQQNSNAAATEGQNSRPTVSNSSPYKGQSRANNADKTVSFFA